MKNHAKGFERVNPFVISTADLHVIRMYCVFHLHFFTVIFVSLWSLDLSILMEIFQFLPQYEILQFCIAKCSIKNGTCAQSGYAKYQEQGTVIHFQRDVQLHSSWRPLKATVKTRLRELGWGLVSDLKRTRLFLSTFLFQTLLAFSLLLKSIST